MIHIDGKDLIETLWNVKEHKEDIVRRNEWRFNRDIMECKVI